MVYTKNTDRMDFILNTRNNTVLVKQKWKYSWLLGTGVTRWTQQQRSNFHNSADRLIWRQWAGRYTLKCRGTSSFARANRATEFTVNFDIEWALTNEHWNVRVTKIPNGETLTSQVNWNTKTVQLDTEDNELRYRTRGGVSFGQYPVVHEFGHAIGNHFSARRGMHSDEYNSSNRAHLLDHSSVLNVGRELRNRHLDYVLVELQSLIPNTTFYIHHVLNP